MQTFPEETTTCICSHKDMNSATAEKDLHALIQHGCRLDNQRQNAARPPHNPTTCTPDTACLSYQGEHHLHNDLCLLVDHGIYF